MFTKLKQFLMRYPWMNRLFEWGQQTADGPAPMPTVKVSGVAGAILFFCAMLLLQGRNFEKLYDSSQHDLRAYLACAHNIVAGRHMYTTHHQAIPEDPTLTSDVPKYLYPPLLGMLMIPTTVFSYDTFKHIWFFLNFFFLFHGIFLAVTLLPFGRFRSTAFFLVSAVFVGSDILPWLLRTAQADGFVIWMSTVSLWLFHRQKWLASAILISAAAWIKVTPGLFFVYMITRGNLRFTLWAVASGLVLGLIQFGAFPEEFRYFFTDTISNEMPNPMQPPVMQSLWSLAKILVVPWRGRLVFDAPEQFESLLLWMKIGVAAFTGAVLLRKRTSADDLLLGFAVCCSASLLITDISWIMRFIWSFISTAALLFVATTAQRWWTKALFVPLCVFAMLLNMGMVWKGAFAPLTEWRAIFIVGPALHALFCTVFLGTLCMIKSEWIWPIQKGVAFVRTTTARLNKS